MNPRKGFPFRKKRWTGPVILPAAVESYLSKEVDDLSWLKKASYKDLAADLDLSLFHTKPYHHQLVCYTIGQVKRNYLFFLDMGAGKTKIILDLARYYKKKRYPRRFRLLVAVPQDVNTEAWAEELRIHAPDLTCVQLVGTREERFKLIKQKADLYFINYDGLMVYMSQLAKTKDKSKGKDKSWRFNKKMAEDFASNFDGMVLDECHMLGNQDSLIFRLCHHLSKKYSYRWGLTGTPFGKDPIKLLSQFELIDHGETLGTTKGMFRAAFYRSTENRWGGVDYTFLEDKKEDLHRLIRNCSIRYEDEEFADLPELTKQVRRLKLPAEPEAYYREALKEVRNKSANGSVVQNAFIRMRQITAGFLSYNGDDGKATIIFDQQPKLETLMSLVDSLPEDRKMIIAHWFVYSGKMIIERLENKKLKWSQLGGGAKRPIEQMKRFLNDDDCRFMVANVQAGLAGLNPQKVCNYLTCFESPTPPDLRKQLEKRVHRDGQKRHTYITDLVIKNSVDERILTSLEDGEDLFQAVCNGKFQNAV